jgi:hypothetical protein
MVGQANFYRHRSHFLNHRLTTQGEDPTLLFVDKKNDKTLSESMREKFHTVRGVRRLDVPSICDPTIRIVMQALACKLLRKCRKDQVPIGVIVAAEKCVEGVSMSWEPFLLNQFLIDCTGSTRQRHGISLFLVVNSDCIHSME